MSSGSASRKPFWLSCPGPPPDPRLLTQRRLSKDPCRRVSRLPIVPTAPRRSCGHVQNCNSTACWCAHRQRGCIGSEHQFQWHPQRLWQSNELAARDDCACVVIFDPIVGLAQPGNWSRTDRGRHGPQPAAPAPARHQPPAIVPGASPAAGDRRSAATRVSRCAGPDLIAGFYVRFCLARPGAVVRPHLVVAVEFSCQFCVRATCSKTVSPWREDDLVSCVDYIREFRKLLLSST